MAILSRALGLVGGAALGAVACSVLGSSLDHFTKGGGDAGEPSCPAGQEKCGDVCVDTASDPAHCGGCEKPCPAGQVCDQAKCSSTGCSAGKTDCGGACVSLDSDPLHCGDCAGACNPGDTCGGGKCAVSCFPPQTACDLSCVDLQKDDQNCGKCDNPCPVGQACSAAKCVISCTTGQTECSGACVDTLTNVNHCGGCGKACKPGETCNAGACKVACPGTQTECSGLCYDLQKDLSNCGSCGNACKAGELCGNGQCALDCDPGLTPCNGSCVDLGTDSANCGNCGNACGSNQECDQGKCVLACKTLLNSPVKDPWGYGWDGLERAPALFSQAETNCSGIGGRLPTASEAYRVSATQSATVGQSTSTNYLWTAVPYGPSSQIRVRLNDGYAAAQAKASSSNYRCVCPPPLPKAYAGNNCFGAAGTACYALDGDNKKIAVDTQDRPALPKGSAIWECAFYRGHLASPIRLAEAVQQGVGTGSNVHLHTADEVRGSYDLVLRWSTGAFDLATAVTTGTTTSSRPFRCAGPNYEAGTHPVTITNEWVGPLSGNKGETQDNPVSSYAAAVSTCWGRGGHVPIATELGEIVGQGLPSGSGAWLWTADEAVVVSTTASLEVFSWQNTTVPIYANGTDLSMLSKTTTQPSRCIYYPVDTTYTGPTAASCNGGCKDLALGGSSGAKVWLDSTDRAAATLNVAIDACRKAGGHLATARDLVEAIRAGLPNGSALPLWAGDFLQQYNSTLGYQLRVTTIHWTWTDTNFSDLWSTYQGVSDPGSSRAYRCAWTNEIR